MIRVGMATESGAVGEAIEEAVRDSGLSMTEFLAEAMNAEDDLEHEAIDFEEDLHFFYSEIEFPRPEELTATHLRDEVVLYLEGYIEALSEHIESAAD